MFSDSVSDAHVGCCSPSRLRMRGAVYALPVLVLVVCRIRSGRLSVAIRLLSLSAAPAGVLSNHTIHHTPHAHSPRNIRTPHTPHTTHTTLTPHTTRHSFLRIRKSGMVCPWWYIWDALRCLIKFNKSIQSSQVKTSYTKSYPHKYTYKDTHKDTHTIRGIQVHPHSAIHTNTRSNLRHSIRPQRTPTNTLTAEILSNPSMLPCYMVTW
jgi:hypothetical protein